MSTNIIVSYDGTSNDDDAVALAKLLAKGGASLALAYVRHAPEFDPKREELAAHDADRRLEQGAALLGAPDTPRHVVVSASTGEGLEQLATAEGASLIVFGSDYRTPPGHAEPGNTAQHLLEGGSVAVAVAAAGLRTQADAAIESIASERPAATPRHSRPRTHSPARHGAEIVNAGGGPADLIVVGSNGSKGRISLSGVSRSQLNQARGSVLVVPHGKPVLL